jgi:hypothetical protein
MRGCVVSVRARTGTLIVSGDIARGGDRQMHTESDPLARTVADSLAYDDLPDFDVFNTAAWAVQDSVERVAEGEA